MSEIVDPEIFPIWVFLGPTFFKTNPKMTIIVAIEWIINIKLAAITTAFVVRKIAGNPVFDQLCCKLHINRT